MFWFFFSFLVIVFAYLGDENNIVIKSNYKLFRVLLVITLSYVVGFGGQPFADHQAYVNFYRGVRYIDYNISIESVFNFSERSNNLEFGYYLLNKICSTLGMGVPGFFFIVALIVNTLLVKVCYNEFKNQAFIFLIFIMSLMFFQQMNLVRQMIAVSLFLYSIKFLIKGNPFSYISMIIIASLFHLSAIILIILAPLSLMNLNKKSRSINIFLLLMWLISLIIGFGFISIDIIEYIPILPSYKGYYTTEGTVGMDSIINIEYNFFVLLLFLFYIKNDIPIIYSVIFVLGVVINNLSVTFVNILRFSYYFTIIIPAYIPTMLTSLSNKKYKDIFSIIYYSLVAIYILRLFKIFIFNENVLVGSKMYNLSEFFM